MGTLIPSIFVLERGRFRLTSFFLFFLLTIFLYLSQNKNQFINLKREQMQTKAPKTELQEELKEQLLCVIEDLDKDFDRLNRLKDEDPKFMVKLHNLCERVEDTLASYRMDFGYQKMDLYKEINS